MKKEIKITEDGSPTIYLPEINEHYHSFHGAITESMHVFITNGLQQLSSSGQDISILEIGLGTGLNVLLSMLNGVNNKIYYHALEPFPLDDDVIEQLNFNLPNMQVLEKIHQAEFMKDVKLSDNFIFQKMNDTIEDVQLQRKYDLIYFDAFGPQVQPEIWCAENFKKIFNATEKNGILVTYCSKGDVRRAMIHAGYQVEKIPGPPGKREMLRARK